MNGIYFIAGEASGDTHGAALMQALRGMRPDLKLLGRGGPRMQALADPSFRNWTDEAAVVGLSEVIKHYGFFRREFRRTLAEITDANPDAVVLIDYPGFNLRLAHALFERSLGGKIIYYISPQVWAWNRARIPKMARWLDLMLCIFPFEEELYEQSGLRTLFVGHPMIENLEAKRTSAPRRENLIGLFPGSRMREVGKLVPVLLETMKILRVEQTDLEFEIAAASPTLAAFIEELLEPERRSLGRIAVTIGEAAAAMQRCAAGIVASGTATLEAAFFRLPFVLVYKVAPMTYFAGKMLVQVPHLGMPNVLAGREIVPEFIQKDAQPERIARAVLQLLRDDERRAQMVANFDSVISPLGKGGVNLRAAKAILEELAET